MTALRKKSDRSASFGFDRRDFIVDFSEDVTPAQIKQLEELVQKEFETGNWVTEEQDS
ncbi:hypothetical protein QCM77_20935 [Bradyrhizobium sp. SSUT18]|uniref:hypothetical protein n=1 Tax=Bradyrhizobium sp. SSUT18 TaxID=3040602 RepID=UPI002448997E|nr:hypothetical protein [Bradyrhizobium sp. SSUT18]MDH2402408.1 hypothetical protein [Bradyrhizobium sp. SSUT18]